MTHGSTLTAEILVDGRDPGSPVLAPGGRLVAYVLGAEVRLAGDGEPRRVSGDGCRPRWSADSWALFYLSGGELCRFTLDDAEVTRAGAGVVDHLPLAGTGLVALLVEDPPAGKDDDVVAGRDERRVRLRLLDPDSGLSTRRTDLWPGSDTFLLCQRPTPARGLACQRSTSSM